MKTIRLLVCISFLCFAFSYELFAQFILQTSDGKVVRTSDGTGIVMTPFTCGTSTVSDYDGNTYNTVLIGTQCWMGANLNVTHYADGTAITYISTDAVWLALSSTDQAYTYYSNDVALRNVYGCLYTWATAMKGASSSTAGVQGICPNGWHLPSQTEWNTLATTLGGSSLAGGAMKETGTVHWTTPNTGATNSSGFAGLPGGDRSSSSGGSSSMGSYGNFWSTEEASSTYAYYRYLSNSSAILSTSNFPKKIGFSVRCIKN